MRLDRYTTSNGRGKYALLKLRGMPDDSGTPARRKVDAALETLAHFGMLDWGTRLETEFFVIRLADLYAQPALYAYALAADIDDPEYAADVRELADRAGKRHPFCKKPD